MNLGNLAMFQREHQRAIGLFEESLALYKTAGSITFTSMLLYFLAAARLREGELTKARVLIEEVQALVRIVRSKWEGALALNVMGEIALLQGEMERAERRPRREHPAFSGDGGPAKLGVHPFDAGEPGSDTGQ